MLDPLRGTALCVISGLANNMLRVYFGYFFLSIKVLYVDFQSVVMEFPGHTLLIYFFYI